MLRAQQRYDHMDQVILKICGVIWFLSHVLQLLLVKFTQQNFCCISKSTMKHMRKLD